jgi:hypothetical protein
MMGFLRGSTGRNGFFDGHGTLSLYRALVSLCIIFIVFTNRGKVYKAVCIRVFCLICVTDNVTKN